MAARGSSLLRERRRATRHSRTPPHRPCRRRRGSTQEHRRSRNRAAHQRWRQAAVAGMLTPTPNQKEPSASARSVYVSKKRFMPLRSRTRSTCGWGERSFRWADESDWSPAAWWIAPQPPSGSGGCLTAQHHRHAVEHEQPGTAHVGQALQVEQDVRGAVRDQLTRGLDRLEIAGRVELAVQAHDRHRNASLLLRHRDRQHGPSPSLLNFLTSVDLVLSIDALVGHLVGHLAAQVDAHAAHRSLAQRNACVRWRHRCWDRKRRALSRSRTINDRSRISTSTSIAPSVTAIAVDDGVGDQLIDCLNHVVGRLSLVRAGKPRMVANELPNVRQLAHVGPDAQDVADLVHAATLGGRASSRGSGGVSGRHERECAALARSCS